MKRVEHSHLGVFALTDKGARGKDNEDRYGVSAYRRKDRPSTPVLLAVVADGIGGHRAGEVAADIAVNLISTSVADAPESLPPVEVMQKAVQAASQEIYTRAAADPQRSGMGATCAIAYVIGSRLYAANVGDSRIYLLRGGQLRQLSVDHTWIQEALDHGLLTADEIPGHPNSHVIRRYLGSAQPPEAAIAAELDGEAGISIPGAPQGIALLPEDILLLCSDGLTDLVSDEEIAATLSSQTLEAAANQLIELANQRGGHDNITVVLLQGPPAAIPKDGRARRLVLAGCAALVLMAILVTALAFVFNTIVHQDPTTATPQGNIALPTVAIVNTSPVILAGTLNAPQTTSQPTLRASSTSSRLATVPPAATLTPWPTSTRAPGTGYP